VNAVGPDPATHEQLVDDLIERTIEPCKKALKDASMKASEIGDQQFVSIAKDRVTACL
jgi:molecular chaperone DnaK (HSP70)